MQLDLSGKRALVCGSTQGIGRAAAFELAELGAHVTVFARNGERVSQVREQLPTSKGQKHHMLVADFSRPDSVAIAIDTYVKRVSDVHILVNNTGGPPAGPALEASEEDFFAAFNAHLICNQLLAQALVPGMKAAQYGRIINVISTSVKAPLHNLGVSNTIRGAVASWAKTLANELGPFGITVNNVLPGFTTTARLDSILQNGAAKAGVSVAEHAATLVQDVPARRFATPEEVAAAIAFLATPAAAYINGINLPVDGGRTPCL
jgi:3-oxoacyl-[acyl-carrier protein] reductase